MSNFVSVTVELGDECTQTTHCERHAESDQFDDSFAQCVVNCAFADSQLDIEAIAMIVENALSSLERSGSDDHTIRMCIAQMLTACEAAEERLGSEYASGG